MTTIAIPAWNAQGLLPPIDLDAPTSPERSPYVVSLLDVVKRFGTTAARRQILRGFLTYRAELHRFGLVDGFQWLNGSFSEDVENLEQRPPKDIDVVSFFENSGQIDSGAENIDADLFDHDIAKQRYCVDSYVLELDQLVSREVVFWSAYWYSMWSHRRNQNWKGFLQVELAPIEDKEAAELLNEFDAPKEMP